MKWSDITAIAEALTALEGHREHRGPVFWNAGGSGSIEESLTLPLPSVIRIVSVFLELVVDAM